MRTKRFYARRNIRNGQHQPSPSRDLAKIASGAGKGQPDISRILLMPKSSCYGDNAAHFTPGGAIFFSPNRHAKVILSKQSDHYTVFLEDSMLYQLADKSISYRNGEILAVCVRFLHVELNCAA